MTTFSPTIETMITKNSSFASDFLRYCLSDNLSAPITAVLQGKTDPVTFAGLIAKKESERVYNHFLGGKLHYKDASPIIEQAWVYDNVAVAALFLRLGTIFPEVSNQFKMLYANASIYLLNTFDRRCPISAFGGMTHFVSDVSTFKAVKPDTFKRKDAIFFTKVLDVFSQFDDPNWLMWNDDWEVLLHNPYRLKAFRRFLHACYSAYVMLNFETCFGMQMDDLISYMIDFVELAESRDTSRQDIVNFSRRLCFNFDEPRTHPGSEILLEGPFELATLFHAECQGNPMLFNMRMNQTSPTTTRQ